MNEEEELEEFEEDEDLEEEEEEPVKRSRGRPFKDRSQPPQPLPRTNPTNKVIRERVDSEEREEPKEAKRPEKEPQIVQPQFIPRAVSVEMMFNELYDRQETILQLLTAILEKQK